MGEGRGEYTTANQAEVISELLRLFTLEQLAEICADFKEISKQGYGSITIEVEGDWINLKPSPSKRIGRLKKG